MKSFLVSARNNLLARLPILQRAIKFLAVRRVLPPSIWSKLQPVGVFQVNLPDGKRFQYCALANDQLARSIVWTDCADWETLSLELFYRLAQQAEYVLDVGAYTGIYALVACAANPNTFVELFEPNPEMQANIVANIQANRFDRRISVHECALSNQAGVLEFVLTPDRTASRLSTAYDGSRVAEQVITVAVQRLDDVIDPHKKVDLVKIDAESNEIPVLEGMLNLLTRHRPDILIECVEVDHFYAARQLLAGAGYRDFYYISRHGLRDTSQPFQPEPRYPNYLCVAGARASSLLRSYLPKVPDAS